MDVNQDYYKCSKCGNTLLKTNQLLHDLKCVIPKKNNITDNINNNDNNLFNCSICGMTLKNKDKADHLVCHEIEKEEEKKNYINDSLDSDEDIPYNNINNRRTNNHRNYERVRNDVFDFLNNINVNDNNDNSNNFRLNNRNRNNNRRNEIGLGNFSNSDHSEIDSFDDLDHLDDINGLDEDTIKQYPSSKIKDIKNLTEDKKRCSICLENFKNGDDSIILPCIHIFHAECIKKWMKRKNACPICKSKIDNNEIDDIDSY
jgi:hypothetical protein